MIWIKDNNFLKCCEFDVVGDLYTMKSFEIFDRLKLLKDTYMNDDKYPVSRMVLEEVLYNDNDYSFELFSNISVDELKMIKSLIVKNKDEKMIEKIIKKKYCDLLFFLYKIYPNIELNVRKYIDLLNLENSNNIIDDMNLNGSNEDMVNGAINILNCAEHNERVLKLARRINN